MTSKRSGGRSALTSHEELVKSVQLAVVMDMG